MGYGVAAPNLNIFAYMWCILYRLKWEFFCTIIYLGEVWLCGWEKRIL